MTLPLLQRSLLEKAFSVLRPDGVLLYVTCSADRAQGEDVIEWLLERCPDAKLERVETHGVPAQRVGPAQAMVRFTPADSQTSGLFVSRITRMCCTKNNV